MSNGNEARLKKVSGLPRPIPLGKLLLNLGTEAFAVGTSRGLGLSSLHDSAHLGFSGCSNLGDRLHDQSGKLLGGKGGRKINGEYGNLGLLFLGHLGTASLLETGGSILTLLDLLPQDGCRRLVIDHGIGAALLDSGILKSALHHAERAQLGGVAGFHGFLEVVVDAFGECHGIKG